jgi:alpha/beta superfamily hydrolase
LPKLVIAADNDFATPLPTTRQWFKSAMESKHLVVLEAAEHFYRDQEDAIIREIVQWTEQ